MGHQPKFFRQCPQAACDLEGGLAIGDKLVEITPSAERVGNAGGMVERFRESKPPSHTFFRQFRIAGHLEHQRHGDHGMRANAWIVAAERCAEMTMAGQIVGIRPNTGIVKRRSDIAAEKSCRPAAMISFE
jgi:hypothetical protein